MRGRSKLAAAYASAGVQWQGSRRGSQLSTNKLGAQLNEQLISPSLLESLLPSLFSQHSHQRGDKSKMPTEVEGTHQIGDMSLYTKTWKVRELSLQARGTTDMLTA